MKREFSKKSYELYMLSIKKKIGIELDKQKLRQLKLISKLSFEKWVKYQNGEFIIK